MAISFSSKIHGMNTGNKQAPHIKLRVKYHLQFDTMDDAYKLVSIFAPDDSETLVTTLDRPNMFLLYNSKKPTEVEQKVWTEMKYYECADIELGYYGENYYLFGNGKVFHKLPESVD